MQGTADLSVGSGAIHRHNSSREGMQKSYSPYVNTLYENFLHAYNMNPNANFVGWRPIVDGEAQPYMFKTYMQSKEEIEAYSRCIAKYEFLSETKGYEKRHDGSSIRTIGHFMKNSMPLLISQFAAWRMNGTVVPLYDTLGVEAITHVCDQAELKTVLCSPGSAELLLRSIKDAPEQFVCLKNLIIANGEISDTLRELAASYKITLYSFDELIEEGKTLMDSELPTVTGDDICMICYTSGTTGTPKGAIFSHQNLVSVGAVCKEYIDEISHFGSNDYYISYLPMAHAFEHFMQTACIADGMGIGFSQGDTRKIVDDFKELRPSVFASVPRLLSRITDKVRDTVKKSSFVKRTIFNLAFNTKKRYIMKYNLIHCPFWDSMVFAPILKSVGLDNVRAMVTGSAPITEDNLLFLRVLFLCPIIQGLGLTETSGGACCTLPTDHNTFNHCGSPIKASEVKLVSVPEMGYTVSDRFHGRIVDKDGKVIKEGIPCNGRGEGCFRGYNVIKGYYREPQITSMTFDKEGWFHSGDIAIWNEYGGYQIVDRIKDIFKMSQGEYISPDKITGVYSACPVVGNIFVYGDSYQSFLVAIVIPSEWHLRQCLRERKIPEKDIPFAELCKMPEVKAVVYDEMNKVANESKLVGFEKVKNIYVDCEQWTIENGMLTPTMKLKRQASKNKYKDMIDKMYEEGMYSPPK